MLSKKLRSIRFRLYRTFEEQMTSLLASVFPLEYLEKGICAPVIAPFYHIVSDERVDHVVHLYSYRNTDQFKADLDFFLKNYQPIQLMDLLASVRSGNTLKEKVFLLSFDDGFSEIYDVVAPILKQKGVPAVFFITTSFLDNQSLGYRHKASILVERYGKLNCNPSIVNKVAEVLRCDEGAQPGINNAILSLDHLSHDMLDSIASVLGVNFEGYLSDVKPYLTSAQVSSLVRDGFYIGAHSVNHCRYRSLPEAEQIAQTIDSVALIKQKFDLDYSLFAFPFSDYGVRSSIFSNLSDRIDLFFGTSAFCTDCVTNIVQRFWMENTVDSAAKILSRLYGRNHLRRLLGRNSMDRQKTNEQFC